ncbi:MAG: serine hydrolase [Leptolyngbyaceae cyanobacterium RU_5_1]|nr:serine hydrolase [Leptolyngbyaceae cyanobacterium RU_5_1]
MSLNSERQQPTPNFIALDPSQVQLQSDQAGELTERSLTTPTAWWWLTGVSEATIKEKIAEGFRMIELNVESTSPYRFTVAFVKNEGVHQKTWWWYYGKTSQQVKDLIDEKKGRMINLKINFVDGEKRYAFVMVSNTGADAKTWWYYSQLKFEEIDEKLGNDRRLVDLDSYVVNGDRFFSAVMIPNTGVDQKAWWYYSNLTSSEIAQKLSENNARLTLFGLRSQSSSNKTYLALMEKRQGESWWWYFGQTMDQVNQRTAQHGARMISVDPYIENGGKRFNVVLLNNSNELTSRLRRSLADSQDGGAYGLYLKQVGGAVLASLQSQRPFYPASTIKVLEHVHAMLRVDRGFENLDTTRVTKYPDASDSCSNNHSGQTSTRETLRQALKNMMENSDNQSTNALQEYFGNGNAVAGRNAINMTAHNTLGLTNATAINHKFGCGGPNNNPANSLTLSDLGKLYEEVASGLFRLEANRDTFYDLMLTGLGAINTVVDEEASSLNLAQSTLADFKNRMRTAAKAGSFSTNTAKYSSIGGWVVLPVKRNNTIISQEYVFGLFIDAADRIDENFSIWDARAELLRDEIRFALASFR